MFVGGDLPFVGLITFETFQGIRNIIRHVKVNAAYVIITNKDESKVALAFSVLYKVIVFLDAIN